MKAYAKFKIQFSDRYFTTFKKCFFLNLCRDLVMVSLITYSSGTLYSFFVEPFARQYFGSKSDNRLSNLVVHAK